MAEEYITIDHLTTEDLTRFFSRISINKTTNCWNWTGTKAGAGYGSFSLSGKRIYIHRLIYAWLIGPLPVNWRENQIDHLCLNRGCCNPAHLECVTRRENIHRSACPSGINAKKSHCKYGHELIGHNLVLRAGKRYCRECTNARARTPESRAKKKAWIAANIDRVRAQAVAAYWRDPQKRRESLRRSYHKCKQDKKPAS